MLMRKYQNEKTPSQAEAKEEFFYIAIPDKMIA